MRLFKQLCNTAVLVMLVWCYVSPLDLRLLISLMTGKYVHVSVLEILIPSVVNWWK